MSVPDKTSAAMVYNSMCVCDSVPDLALEEVVTPRACARGKVISLSSVVVVVVGTKIARSRDLGVYVCCKHNQSVDICEKLLSVCFE